MNAIPTQLNAAPHLIVIGAGISGLTTALYLSRAGYQVTVLERAARVGGLVESVASDGFVYDLGPQSFLLSPALQKLIREVGLEQSLLQAPARAPRFVYAADRLWAVPLNPFALLTTPLFGWSTKRRLLLEPLRRTQPPENETVAAFTRRKFGEEFLDRLVGPFVSGIYAGDPERLGLRDAFPDLYTWEREHGSVVRGALRQRRPQERSGLVAVAGGNARLIEALARQLGNRVLCGVAVEALELLPGESSGRFVLHLSAGADRQLMADAVVVATSAPEAARLLQNVDPAAASLLQQVEYAPVGVVVTSFRRDQIQHSLEGFGFLLAEGAWAPVLGTVWTSSLFADRAPAGMCTLVSFVGGARYPEALEWPEDRIAGCVQEMLRAVVGSSGPPQFCRVRVHRPGLPQYVVGHRSRMDRLRVRLAALAGLYLVGNYLEGISLPACVELAMRTARKIAEQLCVGTPARLAR
jgi:oxygen-dependent protoporphyrinogen oxidase